MNSIRLRSDLTGSSIRKPVRLAQAGSAQAPEDAVGEHVGGPDGELLGHPERHARPGCPRDCRR